MASSSAEGLFLRPEKLKTSQSVAGLEVTYRESRSRLNRFGQKEKLGQMFENKTLNGSTLKREKYQAEAEYFEFTPQWRYGLTDRWSLHFQLPLYQVRSQIKQTQTQITQDFEAQSQSASRPQQPDSLDQGSAQFYLGAAVVGTQLLLLDRAATRVGFFQTLQLPTASEDDTAYFTQGAPEAFGYGVGAGLSLEQKVGSSLTFISALSAMTQFEDEVFVEIENFQNAKTSRNPGEKWKISAFLEQQFLKSHLLSAGYTREQKSKDELKVQPVNTEAYRSSDEQKLFLAYELRDLNSNRFRLSYSQLVDGYNVMDESAAGFEFRLTY